MCSVIDLWTHLLGMGSNQAYSFFSFSSCQGHQLLLQVTCHWSMRWWEAHTDSILFSSILVCPWYSLTSCNILLPDCCHIDLKWSQTLSHSRKATASHRLLQYECIRSNSHKKIIFHTTLLLWFITDTREWGIILQMQIPMNVWL